MMHIATAGDIGVFSGIELMMYSTMRHNDHVRWHILTMDCEVDYTEQHVIRGFKAISKDQADWLTYMVRFMDVDSTVEVHDMAAIHEQYFARAVNNTSNFTPYAALRLALDRIPEIPHCLYLDADIIVQENLIFMYDRYLSQEIEIAAYSSPGACEGWGELVSGVMVMDLERMRETGRLERARQFYHRFPYKYPDQMAIEKSGKWTRLSPDYDYIEDHKKAEFKPAILHFTNNNEGKICTMREGDFYRFYPEHMPLYEGIQTIKNVYYNYFPDRRPQEGCC